MARRKAPGALPTMLVSAESVSYDRTKFNMHIVKYWRPDGCTSLRVAFLTWHNETVNIYTHLLPIPFVAMLLLRDYGGAVTPLQSRALAAHVIAVLICAACSATMHTLESFGNRIFEAALAIDMAGAFIACVGHALLISYLELEAAGHLQLAAGAATSLVVLAVLGGALFATGTMNSRPKPQSAALMGTPYLVCAASLAVAGRSRSCWVLCRFTALFALVVVIWVCHLPEALIGKRVTLDRLGNSHNIMHCGTLLVFYLLNTGYADLLPQGLRF